MEAWQKKQDEAAAEDRASAEAAGCTVEELQKQRADQNRAALRAGLPAHIKANLEAIDRARAS